jgi:hypothetical protein
VAPRVDALIRVSYDSQVSMHRSQSAGQLQLQGARVLKFVDEYVDKRGGHVSENIRTREKELKSPR